MTEKDILSGLASADNKVFAYLYQEYFGMVKYFVTKNSGDEKEAKDLFQEVVIVLFEKARDQNLSLTVKLKTFIYSIARNM